MPHSLTSSAAAITTHQLNHRYGDHLAVRDLSLSVEAGEIFGFLGPNGGGKTTLFRLLSTLIPVQSGEISIFGNNLTDNLTTVRQQIGVVFQAPSLDKKLTVSENLGYQGALYGLHGSVLKSRIDEMLSRLGIVDRARDLVETLSGGLRRRVELAKGMLHHPRLLLLDEPSTGLDPGARSDLWEYLELIRARDGVTVVLTTHLLEEAEKTDRIAILNRGELVALDSPSALRAELGPASIMLEVHDNSAEILAQQIAERFSVRPQVVGRTVRLQHADAYLLAPKIAEAFPQQFETLTIGRPSLEDVFIARTGHRFWQHQDDATP